MRQQTDVSALGRVDTLSLIDTPVTDVSTLGGVDTLDLNKLMLML